MARCRQFKSVRYRRISKNRDTVWFFCILTLHAVRVHSAKRNATVRPSVFQSVCLSSGGFNGGNGPSSLEPQKFQERLSGVSRMRENLKSPTPALGPLGCGLRPTGPRP